MGNDLVGVREQRRSCRASSAYHHGHPGACLQHRRHRALRRHLNPQRSIPGHRRQGSLISDGRALSCWKPLTCWRREGSRRRLFLFPGGRRTRWKWMRSVIACWRRVGTWKVAKFSGWRRKSSRRPVVLTCWRWESARLSHLTSPWRVAGPKVQLHLGSELTGRNAGNATICGAQLLTYLSEIWPLRHATVLRLPHAHGYAEGKF